MCERRPVGHAREIACALSILLSCGCGVAHAQPRPQGDPPFHALEATIDGIHAALRSGQISCGALVQAYLNRIAAYDQAGPTFNAVQNINPDALRIAADMDARFRAPGELGGPLACIPILVKDEVNTNFMPT